MGVLTVFLKVATRVALLTALGTIDFVNLVFLVRRRVKASGLTAFLQGAMLFNARKVSSCY